MVERILIFNDKFPNVDEEKRILSDTGVTVDATRTRNVDEAIENASDADVVLTQGLTFDEEALRALGHLEAIGVYGTGTDGIDVSTATEERIRVINVPEYGADEVSTHALALMLACIRKIVQYDTQVKDGQWDWKGAGPLFRTNTMTLGLVGYGNISRSVAAKSRPFFDEIVAYDPYVDGFEAYVREVDFSELLTASNVVSIHTPLTDETECLFGPAEFETLTETAVLVNVARGGIVDFEALYTALSRGEIGYAGLDVFPEEPPGSHPIFELDNVVCSPHVAWYSETSERELRRSLVRDVRRLVQGDTPQHVVNGWTTG